MNAVRRLQAGTAVLVSVAAVALATTGVVSVRRSATPDVPSGLNLAMIDQDATNDVVRAVKVGFGRILVYDYRHPQRAERAATDFLTSDAADQYREIHDALAAAGRRQKLVHVSTVADVGIQHLTASTAELLVFLEQETVRTTDGATNHAPAQIHVEAVREDGAWKVSSIELL